jgi:hypothetical protein
MSAPTFPQAQRNGATSRTMTNATPASTASLDFSSCLYLFKPYHTAANFMTWGAQVTSAGTLSVVAPTSGSLLNNMPKYRVVNNSTAAGHQASFKSSTPPAPFLMESNFSFRYRFAICLSSLTGHRAFVGLTGQTGNMVTTGDPSSFTNLLGVGFDATDNAAGNWYFMRRDAGPAATRTDTGIPRDTTSLLELRIDTDAAGATAYAQLANLSTGAESARLTWTTNMPAATTLLNVRGDIGTGTLAGSAAPGLDHVHTSLCV